MAFGKIIKAISGFYYVLADNEIIQCRGRGVFRNQNITPLVGDYVEFHSENQQTGVITDIKTRINELSRPPVANIDQAILVFSALEPEFSLQLLDRFLVNIEAKNIKSVICISKIDLLTVDNLSEINRYASIYRKIGYPVLMLSSKEKTGTEQLRTLLAEKVSILAGQSGVGKSSILNAINPDFNIKTAEISTHLGRGKHTTRHVELLEMDGGFVADTPGFSSLVFEFSDPLFLQTFFPEIKQKSEACKFRGCMHIKEPQCAVQQAVEQAEIANFRYDHYLYFLNEIISGKPRYSK